jgi:DNA-binding NtrC family response regulator
MYGAVDEKVEREQHIRRFQRGGLHEERAAGEQVDRKTILLADDEPTVLEVSSEILTVLGYNVLTAERGEDALSLFQSRREGIDLVILDMIMPGMATCDVVNAMQEIRPDVKIVIVSGRKIDDSTRETMKNGYDGFIQKPFSIPLLSSTVSEVLNGA